MKWFNVLFSLYSLVALIVIIERLSPTTKVILAPYNFIGLHEINQTVIFLSITIVISVLLLKLFTNNFQALRGKKNTILLVLFIVGTYLYGAGEGWHEVASFTLNQYCNANHLTSSLCGGLFINDYYAGNSIFFIGGILTNVILMIFSTQRASEKFSNKDMAILIFNSIIYGFTWFAYAAFDKVFIGLISSAILLLISLWFFYKIRSKWREYPYIVSGVTAYALATIGTILVRFHFL
jgi:hypothetical protein